MADRTRRAGKAKELLLTAWLISAAEASLLTAAVEVTVLTQEEEAEEIIQEGEWVDWNGAGALNKSIGGVGGDSLIYSNSVNKIFLGGGGGRRVNRIIM